MIFSADDSIVEPGKTLTVRVNGTNDDTWELYCNASHTCKIDCQSSGACSTLFLYCFGTCLVSCNEGNGIDCPYFGIYSEWTTQPPTDYPTKQPNLIPSSNSSMPTIITTIPTAQPSMKPTSSNPTVLPTDVILKTTQVASSTQNTLQSTTKSSSLTTTGTNTATITTQDTAQSENTALEEGTILAIIIIVCITLIIITMLVIGYKVWSVRVEQKQSHVAVELQQTRHNNNSQRTSNVTHVRGQNAAIGTNNSRNNDTTNNGGKMEQLGLGNMLMPTD